MEWNGSAGECRSSRSRSGSRLIVSHWLPLICIFRECVCMYVCVWESVCMSLSALAHRCSWMCFSNWVVPTPDSGSNRSQRRSSSGFHGEEAVPEPEELASLPPCVTPILSNPARVSHSFLCNNFHGETLVEICMFFPFSLLALSMMNGEMQQQNFAIKHSGDSMCLRVG